MIKNDYKYFELQENEYVIKNNLQDINEDIFNKELNEIKEKTKVYLDAPILNLFITPIGLLVITGVAVAIVSILIIAFSVILKNNLVYIPLIIAYLLWAFLVVIVVLERKNKNKYLNNPIITIAKVLDDSSVLKKGYLLHYKNVFDEKENEVFFRTSVTYEKLNVNKKEAYDKYKTRDYCLVIVYKDVKEKSYPVRLLLK